MQMKRQDLIEKIKQVMAKRGIDQATVAKELNLAQSTVGRYLRGTVAWVKPQNVEAIITWLSANGVTIPGFEMSQIEKDSSAPARVQEELTVEKAAGFLGTQFGLDKGQVLRAIITAAEEAAKGKP